MLEYIPLGTPLHCVSKHTSHVLGNTPSVFTSKVLLYSVQFLLNLIFKSRGLNCQSGANSIHLMSNERFANNFMANSLSDFFHSLKSSSNIILTINYKSVLHIRTTLNSMYSTLRSMEFCPSFPLLVTILHLCLPACFILIWQLMPPSIYLA